MRPALSRSFRLSVACAVAALTFVPTGALAAAPVGGAALAAKGIVFDRSPGAPRPPVVSAEGWLVADLDTGDVLAGRNPHGRFLPASTIKTLTAIALLPKLDPATKVKPTQAAANIDGTKVGIKPGFPISIDVLFTGMLIYSGNDTATALADAAGGQAAAVRLMNQHAKRLQAGDTLAVNTTGLDAKDQFSSPYDLALMGREALKIPAFRRYTAIKNVMIPSPTGSFEIANKNRLLYTYDGVFGGKTGGTNRALQTYIGFAQRGSRRLIVTIMKTRQWSTEATKLFDWGFAAAGTTKRVGVLVPSLDELAKSPSASASAAGTSSAAAAPATSADGAASAAAPAAASPSARPRATGGMVKPKKQSFADRITPSVDVELRWWYAAVPLALGVLIGIGLAWRRRRRRRHGYYMPQTKLKLPIR